MNLFYSERHDTLNFICKIISKIYAHGRVSTPKPRNVFLQRSELFIPAIGRIDFLFIMKRFFTC